MEIYFLKFAACSSLLFLFYKLLLEREEMHVFKRFYLPGSLLVSALIPLVTFKKYIIPEEAVSKITFLTSNISSEARINWLPILLWSIYAVGVIFFGIIFIKNLSELLRKIRKNPKVPNGQTTDVLLQEQLPPHTFWSFIFLNKRQHEQKQIPSEVYVHEQAHAVQKHSLDVLFIELLQVLLWFFPLIYFLKKAIKLNHEFLADKAVLEKGINRSVYQQTLLAWSSNSLHSNLVNPISYLSIKKRFTVMKKRTSKTAFLLRTFLLAPLLLGLLYSFSSTKIIERPVGRATSAEVFQEKATPKMVAEYNTLAKRFKENGISRADVKSDAFKRMKYIYNLMTPEQRKSAEDFPPPPAPVSSAKEEQKMEEKRAERRERAMERREKDMERREREIEIERREMRGENPPPPPPPPVPTAEGTGHPADVAIPAPPPPPPSPEEAIQGWIEEGAIFYYNGKKVSGEEALKRVKKNNGKNLNVQVRENDSEKVVRISDNEK